MKSILLIISLAAAYCASGTAVSAEELVVYSSRKQHLVKPVFDAYEKKTGIKILSVTDKAPALVERLKAEGKRSRADIYMTVDAGNLWNAAEKGLLKPIKSETLSSNIPDHLRDPNGNWFGLTIRARTIVYAPERVKVAELKDYRSLGLPKWKKRLCLRTAKKVYNQSLVAMLISDYGEKEAESIVTSWVANLATKVFPNDNAVIKAVAAGQCDVGIVNSYYFGRLKKKDPGLKVALFFPKQSTGGVHVNISGAGIVSTSKNVAKATKFLEWMSGDDAQKILAELNHEYPVKNGVPTSDLVKSWGVLEENKNNLRQAGELQGAAIKLMDRVGYR